MTLPVGQEIYSVDVLVVKARGILYSSDDIDIALSERLPAILWDDPGNLELQGFLSRIPTTTFEAERLKEVLTSDPFIEDWRVGEAFAEAYLIDHQNCSFPWPTGRDLKNPTASPAGTDLVGFQYCRDEVRFVFAEVKTSKEQRWPPQVVTSRHGLVKQLETLRDSSDVKHNLVRYLGHRAPNASWYETYQQATARYLSDPADISLFGILIRDVSPNEADLTKRASTLAHNCPNTTLIELQALYLPENSIDTLVDRVTEAREDQS